MRILFVVPPLSGHTNPTIGVGDALERMGHEVAWVGPEDVIGRLLPKDSKIFNVGGKIEEEKEGEIKERAAGMRGAAALKFLWEEFLIPIAEFTYTEVDQVATEYSPDVMVVDQQTVAGAIVARQRGIPWVTSATTPAELQGPFETLPKIGEWVMGLLVDLQVRLGVPETEAKAGDLRFSDQLIIAYTTEALMGDTSRFGPEVVFVGPVTGSRPKPTEFPYDWLKPGSTKILISLGTVNVSAGARFFKEAIGAVDLLSEEGKQVQAVVVAPPDLVGEVPESVLVMPSVPQVELLEHMDLVVSHGGHNTVCETLSCGIPMILAPIRDDQPIVADQVVGAGCGVRVKFGRSRSSDIAAAMREVMGNGDYVKAAKRVEESFGLAGGAELAADSIVLLGERMREAGR